LNCPIAARPDAAAEVGQSAHLVGRDAELAVLDEVLGSGRAQTLVISGEPGIGKTTVWEAGVARAQRAGARVLVARPTESEAGLAYAALTDLLADVADAVAPRLAPPRARMLRVALLLEEPGESPADPRAVGLAVRDTLAALAQEPGGLVVAVDDAQWLDAASLAALEFALRRLPEDAAVTTLVSRRGGGDWEGAVRLELEPLSVGALFRIVRERLGQPVSLPLMRRIHEATGGNPFYALELARRSVERGSLSLPRSFATAAQERLADLPEDTRASLLEVAALSDATVELVQLDTLDAAFAADVLELRGRRIRFAHPLIRSAVYAAATPAERREVHRALAGRVAGEERARHLALSTAGPSAEVAAALEEAARSVADRGAAQTAVELAELALDHTPPDGRSASTVLVASYRFRAGDPAGARALLEPLVAQLDGDALAEALILLAWTREDDFDAAARLCEQALAATGDHRLATESHLRRAEIQLAQGKLDRALEDGRQAVARADALGDPALLTRALSYLSHFQTLAGTVEPGLLERALELERSLGRTTAYYGPVTVLGLRLMCADRLGEARRELERACDAATAAGEETARAALLVHLAQVETRAGEWQRADRRAGEATLLAEQLGLRQIESGALTVTASIAALTGRVDDARAAAQASLAASRGAHDVIFEVQSAAVLGFLELSLENAPAADAHLRELPGIYRRIGYGNPGAAPSVPDAIEAAISVGDLERAQDWLAELDRDVSDPWSRGVAARCRGLLAAAAGEKAIAQAELERAVEEHAASENVFERGRSLLALGELYRRTNQRRRARETLDAARTLFERLGAPIWAERARRELGRIGGRGPRSDTLTATEARVAELVARGRTNREVAALLVVSERTVETHLTHVYRKLGVRSRTELARRLAE
jgi:DNA-binding CsgD family transcriptional regulator